MLKEHYMVGLVFAFMRIVFSFVVVHQLFTTSWTTACQAPLSPLSLRVCSNSCPLSQWCYLTISSSTTSFFLCLQYFPASGSFPMSWLFASGCQNTGASALASILSVNIQGWFPLGLTSWISLQFQGLSRVFSSTKIQKHQFFSIQPSLRFNSHICTSLLEKPEYCLYFSEKVCAVNTITGPICTLVKVTWLGRSHTRIQLICLKFPWYWPQFMLILI